MSNLWILQTLGVILNTENKVALCIQGKYKKSRQINLPVVQMESGDLSATVPLKNHLAQNFSATSPNGEWLSFKAVNYLRLYNKFMPARKRSQWNEFERERHEANVADGCATSPELLVCNSYYYLEGKDGQSVRIEALNYKSHYAGHVSGIIYMSAEELDNLGEQFDGIDVAHDLRQAAWAIAKHIRESKK